MINKFLSELNLLIDRGKDWVVGIVGEDAFASLMIFLIGGFSLLIFGLIALKIRKSALSKPGAKLRMNMRKMHKDAPFKRNGNH